MTENIKTYLVGGAVRDHLLGVKIKDRDFVVVGGTAEAMLNNGFEQVGMGFPVFLHPVTKEEYALARVDTKVGAGYTGFTFDTRPSVTLEEDLSRRDLTINSMALDENDQLVDPFGGLDDLKNRVLKHTSDAFTEDPLRVVRLARFHARYLKLGFQVHADTITLCEQMVYRGDLNHLPAERFWLELTKAFNDADPAPFFQFLYKIGALKKVTFFQKLFPDLYRHDPDVSSPIHTLTHLAKHLYELYPPETAVQVFAAISCGTWNGDGIYPDRQSQMMNAALKSLRAYQYDEDNLYDKFEENGIDDMQELGALLEKCLSNMRAWSSSNKLVDDVGICLSVMKHFGVDPIDPIRFAKAIVAGRRVTSEPYQHLDGKAIGAAMTAARVKLIAGVI